MSSRQLLREGVLERGNMAASWVKHPVVYFVGFFGVEAQG